MRKLLFLLVIFCLSVAAFAVPANRVPVSYRQSDGTLLYVYLTGDESFHYYATLDGVPVVKTAAGDYCYAVLDESDNFVSTGYIAHNKGERNLEEQNIVDANEFSGIKSDIGDIAVQRAMQYTSVSRAAAGKKFEGVMNVPVILVEYADVKFSFSKEVVSTILNKKDYEGYDNPIARSIGSAKDYFLAQSGGAFEPNFIVTDIVTLPNNMAYYGANSNGKDIRRGQMIRDGLLAADENFDFSIFDNDGDGDAEFLYCIYAGYAESVSGNDANTVWPHAWTLSSSVGAKRLDGVRFDAYACSQELAGTPAVTEYYGGPLLSGIGTLCHEFSHTLGLMDVYNVKLNKSETFGYWDLMDSGNYVAEGYVPVNYSAYERELVGWDKIEELSEAGCYSLESISKGRKAYKIVNDANADEYYVLENRQQDGWDSYLFGTGLMITHIDYDKDVWSSKKVNTDSSHQRIALVPADNEIVIYNGLNASQFKASVTGDLWPGTSKNKAFTSTSVPAATLFTGGLLDKPLTNITERNGVVSFHYLNFELETPAVAAATAVTTDAFCANWVAVNGAIEYILVLMDGEGNELNRVTTADASYLYTALEADAVYSYKVAAKDICGCTTEFSQSESVALLPTSINGVEAVENGRCSIYTAGGKHVYTGLFESAPVLPAGVYIITDANGSSKKFVVK